MRKLSWKWFAAVIVLVVAAGLAAALFKAGYACANAQKRAAMKINEANGCIEFWANRYQAGWSAALTVVGTLAAALLAWRAVQAQIGKQNYANAVTLLGLKRQQRRDVDHEFLQIARALNNLRALKAALRTHEHDRYNYWNAAQAMSRRGEFPFLRSGPSGHPMVTSIDEASVRAEAILKIEPNYKEVMAVNSALSEALGPVLGFEEFLFSDLEKSQALIITLNDEIRQIEQIIEAGAEQLS